MKFRNYQGFLAGVRISISSLLVVAALLVLGCGCASRDVNPAAPTAHTGYVDLYPDPDADLSWRVEQFDERKGAFVPVYSDVKYLEGPFLRLAFAPGSHRLRISFLNCVMRPKECEVTVVNGQITPVRVSFSEIGTGSVLVKEENRGGTAYGRFGRRTKFRSAETRFIAVQLSPQEPQPYRLKEQCAYTGSPNP